MPDRQTVYSVVCMKWGKKYSPEYVNKLYNMCRRNISLKFNFICFTDDPSGIKEGVEIKPLPKMKLEAGPERGWLKLSMFSPDVDIPSGRCLFIDLDTVIVDNIDDYFKVDGDLVLVKHRNPSATQGEGMTSVFRFEVGAHPQIYENFMRNSASIKRQYRHEQAYVCGFSKAHNFLSFFPEQWNPSFKHNCMRFFLLGLFLEPKIPSGAKMIIFHGNPTPDMALKGKIKGIKKLFRFVKPPKWLAEYWR